MLSAKEVDSQSALNMVIIFESNILSHFLRGRDQIVNIEVLQDIADMCYRCVFCR